MVGALTLALTAAVSSGPVAAFSAPATVRVGSPVTYVDHSYDPAPGHHITLRIWIGRQGSFSSAGSHRVTLVVEDDRGLMSSVSHTITAVAIMPPPPPPPSQPTASLLLSQTTVRRGDELDVSLQNAPGAEDVRLTLPPAFLETVDLPTGSIDYAQVNQGVFSLAGSAVATTIWVPWTSASPSDGSYTLSVAWKEDGSEHSLTTSFTVSGTDRLALWTQS